MDSHAADDEDDDKESFFPSLLLPYVVVETATEILDRDLIQ